jgi:hypothetical protein
MSAGRPSGAEGAKSSVSSPLDVSVAVGSCTEPIVVLFGTGVAEGPECEILDLVLVSAWISVDYMALLINGNAKRVPATRANAPYRLLDWVSRVLCT